VKINFAWANPITGIREQALPAVEHDDVEGVKRLEMQGRLRLWEELQGIANDPCSVSLHLQIAVGSVSNEGDSVDLIAAKWVDDNYPRHDFAYADPVDGARVVVGLWPWELAGQLAADKFVKQVLIYATIPQRPVCQSDSRPEVPEPPAPPVEEGLHPGGLRTLRDLKDEVLSTVELDAPPHAKATAWALLDIAESLRKKRKHRRVHSAPVARSRRNPHSRHRGLWERFKLWVLGDQITIDPRYTCMDCGDPAPPLDDLCGPCTANLLARQQKEYFEELNPEFADRMNRLTPEEIKAAMAGMSPAAREWGERFEAQGRDPVPEDSIPLELCTCTGDGLRPGGAFCSCEQGRALMRAQEVKRRNEGE
jgi:hypothetical protein